MPFHRQCKNDAGLLKMKREAPARNKRDFATASASPMTGHGDDGLHWKSIFTARRTNKYHLILPSNISSSHQTQYFWWLPKHRNNYDAEKHISIRRIYLYYCRLAFGKFHFNLKLITVQRAPTPYSGDYSRLSWHCRRNECAFGHMKLNKSFCWWQNAWRCLNRSYHFICQTNIIKCMEAAPDNIEKPKSAKSICHAPGYTWHFSRLSRLLRL